LCRLTLAWQKLYVKGRALSIAALLFTFIWNGVLEATGAYAKIWAL
jgi:hypothetical protein